MNSLLALTLVVLIWGMSPVIVRGFKGFLSPSEAASVVVICATATITMLMLLGRRHTFRELADSREFIRTKLVVLSCASLLAFVTYPFLYFSGIQSPSPVEANIVNYTWPLIAIVVTLLLRIERFSLERGVALLLGFGGALLASRSISTLSSLFDLPTRELSRLDDIPNKGISIAVLFAFAGALSYGIYSGILKRVSASKPASLSSVALFYLLLVIASIVHLVWLLFRVLSSGGLSVRFSVHNTLLLLVYACVNLSIGHLLWLYVLSKRRMYDSAITIYLVPVVSTFALSLLGHFEISNGVLTGLTMILMGMYLGQYERVAVPPLLAAVFAVLLSWSLSLAFPARAEGASSLAVINGLFLNMLQVLTAIFGIFSGFVLTRVISQYNESHTAVLRVLDHLNSLEHACCVDRVEELRIAILDEYGLWIECRPIGQFSAVRQQIHSLLSHLESTARDDNRDIFAGLRSELRRWRFLQQQAVSPFEWFILVATAGTLVVLVYNVEWAALTFLIGRVIFVAAILLVILAIREYNSNRPMKAASFLVQAQAGYSEGEFIPYLPRCVIDFVELGKIPLLGMSRFRTHDPDGRGIALRPIPTVRALDSWTLHGLAVLIFVLVAFTTFRDAFNG